VAAAATNAADSQAAADRVVVAFGLLDLAAGIADVDRLWGLSIWSGSAARRPALSLYGCSAS
jgi:hypothetical protein